jgi:hypothetical protein
MTQGTDKLTLAAQERIRHYDQLKRLIDAATRYEDRMEEFGDYLTQHRRKFSAYISHWDAKPMFMFEMRPDEKLADMGRVVERFEAVFGEVKSTKDDAEYEYMTRRRFKTSSAELMIEIPHGSVTCKRVPTGEMKQVEVFKIECVEAPK